MKKTLTIYLLSVTFLTGAFVAIGTAYYATRTLKRAIEDNIASIHQLLLSRFRMFDRLILEEEEVMRVRVVKDLPQIAERLLGLGIPLKEITVARQREILKEFGYSELYLIDRSGKVFNTTFTPDMNLILTDIGKDFEEWLGHVYGEGKVFLDRMILSTRTGILNQYAYYSPAGRDYIIEISVDMRAYLARIHSPDYVDLLFHGFFIDTIKHNNKVVDIDLFMLNDLAKWSVLNEGKTMDPKAAQKLSKADEFRIEENNRLTVYSRFEPMLKEGLFSQRFATKVIYDISDLGGLNTRIAFFSVAIFLVVAPIAFLIVSIATNKKIIAPIQEITKGLNRISKGEYGVPLKAGGDNEIVQIGQAINEMQEEILDREQDLVKSHEKLEELVEERTLNLRQEITERKLTEKALLEAKEIAETATREKDKYVSLIAHDLKAPFASIIGFLELIESEKGAHYTEEDKSLLRKIVASATGAVNTINDILHFSRFQSGDFHTKPRFFDGHMAALTVVANYGNIANEKGIKIVNNVPEGTRLYADPTLFTEVLQNLITNAIKFCNKGDRVEFFIPPNETTVIAVKDTGVGIDEGLLPNIFLSASRTTTVGTAGEKGTGLGLPFCHGIMKAHKGELTVESKNGSGSTFFVRLPNIKPLVLIADDDQASRFILKSHLENIDATIIEAQDGVEALEKIKGSKPHLILLDIVMPHVDGYETLMRIKRDSETEHIPVIIITSDNRLESREKFMRLGADDFIEKPFKNEELIPRVRKFIF